MRVVFRSLLILCLVVPLEARADATVGPAMWKMQTEKATITFLGSFHLISPGIPWYDERVKSSMQSADAVYFEVDSVAIEDPAFVQRMMAAGSLPQGQTLGQTLRPENYAKIVDICGRLGIPVEAVAGYKPWMAGIILSVVHMQMLGFDPAAGVDAVLDKETRATGMTIGAMETAEEQLQAILVMDSLSEAELMKDATDEFYDPDFIPDMLMAWAVGDEQALNRLIIEEVQALPALYEAIFVNRNRRWMVPLENMVDEGGNYLVVVGAGHLIGKDSVISMLRAKGYSVERLYN